jgi:butyryl-CoA dehydrogenase
VPSNPVLEDRTIDFLLYDVFAVDELCTHAYFSDHSRETFDLFLASCRKVAREYMLPAYIEMDADAPRLEGERVVTRPQMKELWRRICELDILSASQPYESDGGQLPFSIVTTALAYLYGSNVGVAGFAGLTFSAAHLIDAFGSEELRENFMPKMFTGQWTGTMALTEPQAGSSLADLRSSATPLDNGRYSIRGSKIFISGGDQDFSENIVNMVLARIDGAPAGTRGISLFAVPRRRPEGDELVDNDISNAGMVHKLGWRALPAMLQNYGERGDCQGWLVGEPHSGLRYMFQMMNESRIGVGLSGAATASVAYHEALGYAKERKQGRPLGASMDSDPVAIIEHADVRRMLLRQKSIVEGSLALYMANARYYDLAAHSDDPEERKRAQQLCDLLTPMTKSFPAEMGFESNALAVQVLGGYGYSTEYRPQAWLRDQKLNSLHEGTTGIQGMDLLGRKVLKSGGASLQLLGQVVGADLAAAKAAGVPGERLTAMQAGLGSIAGTVAKLGAKAGTDLEATMRNSTDFLSMCSIAVVGWLWIKMETAALRRDGSDFERGKQRASQYWFATEMPRIALLAERIAAADDSFAAMAAAEF